VAVDRNGDGRNIGGVMLEAAIGLLLVAPWWGGT
jgi:hypothetical protein